MLFSAELLALVEADAILRGCLDKFYDGGRQHVAYLHDSASARVARRKLLGARNHIELRIEQLFTDKEGAR